MSHMVKVRILADNTIGTVRPQGLRGEWGFSVSIGDILFDTGQTGIARRNASILGVEQPFETIVLSHGHFDHTGGLTEFLDQSPTIYHHPEVWRTRYKDGAHTGIPYTRERIASDATLVEHDEPVEVAPGVTALGEIPRPHPDNPSGVTPVDGTLIEDTIPDDQSIAVETSTGLALILGCCHAGLRNTIEYAETVCDESVSTIIGGTHLVAREPDTVASTAEWLADRIDLIAPAHCTGYEATTILQSTLGERFQRIGVGTEIDLES